MDVHSIATFHSASYCIVKGDGNILKSCIEIIVKLNYNVLKPKTIVSDATMNSCFFLGHREADERLLPKLRDTIEQLITEENVSYFYVGGYGGFDRIAASAVIKVKQQHPGITLMLVLPYHPAERPVETPFGFDGTYYPEGLEKVPKPYAIVRANKIMVNTTEWLVCYVRHGASNSRSLLEYAQRREKKGLIQIYNLAEQEDLKK